MGFAWGSGGRECTQTSTLHGIAWEFTPSADQVTHELNTSQSVVRVILSLLTSNSNSICCGCLASRKSIIVNNHGKHELRGEHLRMGRGDGTRWTETWIYHEHFGLFKPIRVQSTNLITEGASDFRVTS